MNQPKYVVRLLPVAESDLNEILQYIAADNLFAAERLAEKIDERLAQLSDLLHLGRVPRDRDLEDMGYRYLIADNYLVFYKVEESTVFIYRVLHGARDYKELL